MKPNAFATVPRVGVALLAAGLLVATVRAQESMPVLSVAAGAQPVGHTTATLNGELTAGGSADITVYWGADTNAWSGTNRLDTLGEGPFRLRVSGLTPGTTYFYRAGASNSVGTAESGLASFTTATAEPGYGGGWYDGHDDVYLSAVFGYPQINNADGASGITASNAWLNGAVADAIDAQARTYVFWGPNDGGTNVGAWEYHRYTGLRASDESISIRVELLPNTTWFYRFRAITSDGRDGWAAPAARFRTPGPPVIDTVGGAMPVGHTTATLHGQLTAGESANIAFAWGPLPNTEANTNQVGNLGEGPFRLRIDGLAPGQSYAYRIRAINDHGAAESASSPFETFDDEPEYAGGWYDGYDGKAVSTWLVPLYGSVLILR